MQAMQESWVQSLGWEDPLDKSTTTRSRILSWRISCTEVPDRLRGCKELGTTEVTQQALTETIGQETSIASKGFSSWGKTGEKREENQNPNIFLGHFHEVLSTKMASCKNTGDALTISPCCHYVESSQLHSAWVGPGSALRWASLRCKVMSATCPYLWSPFRFNFTSTSQFHLQPRVTGDLPGGPKGMFSPSDVSIFSY